MSWDEAAGYGLQMAQRCSKPGPGDSLVDPGSPLFEKAVCLSQLSVLLP